MNAEELLRSLIETEPLPYVRGFVIPEERLNDITMLLYNGRRNGTVANEIVLRAGNIPEEELRPDFLQGLVNRRLVGYHKYGSAKARTADRLANVRARLERYEEDGNTEWLMDAAVYAWIEFMYPKHPQAHFRATGTDESRGTILADGSIDHGKREAPMFHRHEGD